MVALWVVLMVGSTLDHQTQGKLLQKTRGRVDQLLRQKGARIPSIFGTDETLN